MPQKMTYVNGYGIRYLDYGPPNSSKTLVLLHGIGASAERWSRVVSPLSKYYHLVVPDIIGFGYSDKPTVEYTMDFFVDFLQEFLENLKISKASLVGSSFGGHLATEFAIRFNKRVEKLVLASPAGMMRTSTPALDGYIMAALYPTFENAQNAFRDMAYDPAIVNDETVLDFVNRMRLPNAKYAFMSTLLGMRYAPPLKGRISDIMCPTLLLWGESDRLIPAQYAKDYSEIPDSKIVAIKNCGHTPYIEKPMSFSKVALKFLVGNEA
ncbi:MAG TPA: alpha/beta hydrolase [Nitrososphaera sp.]|nr:alpha/beta hydrolase [Nitrososphaera sp.]